MKTTSAAIKLGIFAIIATIATGILAISISDTQFVAQSSYHAIFTDVTGLTGGDEVRIAGVRVGTVNSIKLYHGSQAEVTLSVYKSQPLPVTTQAQVRYRNLLGQRYVSLTSGSGSVGGSSGSVGRSGPVGRLRPGGTIPVSQTTPALDLTALFNGFRPLLAALRPQDVNQLSFEIVQVFQGEGGTVNEVLAHVASLTESIGNRDFVIQQVIDNLTTVLGALDSRNAQVSSLIGNLRGLVSGLANDRTAIGDSLVSVNTLINTTNGLLTDVRPTVKSDIGYLGQLSKVLADNGGQLNKAFQDLPNNVMVLDRAASYGSWFNFYLCSLDARVGLPGQASFFTPRIVNGTARCRG